jgi:hypothetical protein
MSNAGGVGYQVGQAQIKGMPAVILLDQVADFDHRTCCNPPEVGP